MDVQEELNGVQSRLLDQLSSAAANRDMATVTALSGLAKECETLEVELASLCRRVEAAKSVLNGSEPKSTLSQDLAYSAQPTVSAKTAGTQARNEWVTGLRKHGISLHGHRRRFQTARGQSVAVAFATERSKNRWFLGLPDQPTEIAVLLCRSITGELCDIVLPMSDLRRTWHALSRSNNEVKFNVKKDASRFLLQVPGESLDVTRYVGNPAPLR